MIRRSCNTTVNSVFVGIVIGIICLIGQGSSLNNGLGLTPPMGYNSWFDLMCTGGMNETNIKRSADFLVSSGLHKLGYNYVNLDDCWAYGRDSNGVVYPQKDTFPSGIKTLADYMHSKGLYFGLYTDRGNKTCAGRPGSKNYEKVDAHTYASWGVDFVKEDSCYATQDHLSAFHEYATMRDALNSTGRRIYFNLCGWSSWYAPVGYSLGNSWRIAEDPSNWEAVLVNLDTNSQLARYAGPGGWNDPSLLLGQDGDGFQRITILQQRAQFSIHAVTASPLLLSFNVRNMTQEVLSIYSNQEVININQDTLGRQGTRIVGSDLSNGKSTINVWSRVLTGGRAALLFLNNGNNTADVECDQKCFEQTNLPQSGSLKVRDVWLHKDLDSLTTRTYTAKRLAPNGGVQLLVISP